MRNRRVLALVAAFVATFLVPPGPVRAQTSPPPPAQSWIASASGDKLLAAVSLGATVQQLGAALGGPWLVARDGTAEYWTYSADGDRAWLVATVTGGAVTALQVLAKAHQPSGLRDASGVALGDAVPAARAKHGGTPSTDDGRILAYAGAGEQTFYGIGSDGRLDRIGRARGADAVPLLVRYYEQTGWSPERAVPQSAYGGTAAGQAQYVATLNDIAYPCGGGSSWQPDGAATNVVYAGVALQELPIRCGSTASRRTIYFAPGASVPRPFDADTAAQRELSAASAGAGAGPAAQPQAAGVQGTTASGGPGAVWIIQPNGYRALSGNVDFFMGYVDDPAHPLKSVTLAAVNAAALGGAAPAGGGAAAAAKSGAGVLAASTGGWSIPCGFSSGSGGGKCGFAPDTGDGPACYAASGDFGAYTATSPPVCVMTASDPGNMPHDPHCTPATGATGGPVDAVSGKLWYRHEDAQLSGPFGLRFAHRYDSDHATYQGDLGVGWRDSYGAALDLSQVSVSGKVIFTDAECARSYFLIGGAGSSAYDPNSGGTLTANADGTYALTAWDHRGYAFDATGALTSMTDRAGNAQRIARDASHRITAVSDGLGRSLSFAYDAKNRVTGMTSVPAGVSVTFAYDSGKGCFAGDLCSVKESDGSTWSYQYYDPSKYAGNHLLQYVIDPLGNAEESDTYAQIAIGRGNDYRIVHQEAAGGKNANDYAYAYYGNTGQTTITDAVGHTTTYVWDTLLQEVTSVSGFLCRCNGDTINYAYDQFGRLLSVSEGTAASGRSATYALTYGRDKLFTSPDNRTSYPLVAYPGPTERDDLGLSTDKGVQTRRVQYAYYPVGDPRQDLVNTITRPSLEVANAAATTTLGYSPQGLLTAVSRQGYVGTASVTYASGAAYDARGRLLSTTGPRTDVAQRTAFAYFPDDDADLARRGQLASVTDALNHVVKFSAGAGAYGTYTPFGDPGSTTDANGVETDFDYDALGRRLKSTLVTPGGALGANTTTWAYDARGRTTRITKPLGNATIYQYDAANNVTATLLADAAGLKYDRMAYTYDASSQMTSSSAQACAVPAAACSNWVARRSDALGYLSNGTLATVTAATGETATMAWDAFGNAISTRTGDATNPVTTSYSYDAGHELTAFGLGSGYAQTSYAYDVNGNVKTITPASTPPTVQLYDDFGRLRQRRSPYTGTTTFTYDPAGNPLTVTDANGATTVRAYDALDRATQAVSSRAGVPTETVTFAYDDPTAGAFGIGKPTSMTDPSGATRWTYNRRGQIETTTQTVNGTAYVTTTIYDRNANVRSVTLPSGRVLAYTNDYADRPYSVASGSTVYVSSASYLPFGPRTRTAFGNGTVQQFTYTQRYLPLENVVMSGSNVLVDNLYAEDAVGRVTQIIDKVDPGYSKAYRYGGNSTVLLTSATTGTKLWRNARFTDGFAQNLSMSDVTGHRFGFKYTSGQQLASVFDSDTGVSMPVSYDAAGNQTLRGSVTFRYSPRQQLISGEGLTYDYDGLSRRVMTSSPSGVRASLYDAARHLESESSLSGGAIAYDYVWFAGVPVAQEDIGAATHWTIADEVGTPFLQTTGAGSVFWRAEYEPYGAIYALRTADAHQPLRRPGQEAEQIITNSANGDTSRYYNGYRWYDPRFGRYTQADPIGYGGNPFNLYAYAGGDPITRVDPTGLVEIFVGGAGDSTSRSVGCYADAYRALNSNSAYFAWDEAAKINAFIDSLPADEPINLIGHSYGADTAAKVALESSKPIDTLITIDPVSWFTPNYADIAESVKLWVDVNATGGSSFQRSNLIAGVGSDWGSGPANVADVYQTAPFVHSQFGAMMEYRDQAGHPSPREYLPGR